MDRIALAQNLLHKRRIGGNRIMGKQYHELICIIGRSGSMESVRNDAIGGFNAFVAEQ